MEIDLPRQPGTYILVLEPIVRGVVHVGRLGAMHLRAGRYLYIGSAQGPGGLGGRVNRHLRSSLGLAPRHWHIDHILPCAQVREVWFAGGERRECDWARQLEAERCATLPLAGFGSSDCQCTSHLVHVSSPATLPRLRRMVAATTRPLRLRVVRLG